MAELSDNSQSIKNKVSEFSDLIAQSDDRIVGFLLKHAFVTGPDGKRTDKNELAIMAVAFFAASEPFKVLLRKNIGRHSISPMRLALACCVYFYWAGMLIFFYTSGELGDSFPFWTNKPFLLPIAVFYILLGLFTAISGIMEIRKANQKLDESNNPNDVEPHLYRGDSLFIGDTSISKGNSQTWKRETWFCLFISVLLTILNPFLGGPLLATSISFFINEWWQIGDVWGAYQKRVEKAKQKAKAMQGRKPITDEDFSTVTLN